MLRKLRALSPRGKTIVSLTMAAGITFCITVLAYTFQPPLVQPQTASAALSVDEVQDMQKTFGTLFGSFKEQWMILVNTTATYVEQIQTVEVEPQP